MIATKLDPIGRRYLDATGLPIRIEATDVVRPDAIMFDADTIAVAVDADLAVMMNVAVIHATAGPDPDPTTAVQLHYAIVDDPSRSLMSVDRTALRGAPILFDRKIADRHIGCSAFERKHDRGHLDFMVRRGVDKVDHSGAVVDVEPIACERVLAHHSGHRLVVYEQCVRTIAGWRGGQAFA